MHDVSQTIVPLPVPGPRSAKVDALRDRGLSLDDALQRWGTTPGVRDRALPSDARRLAPAWRTRYTTAVVALDAVAALAAALLGAVALGSDPLPGPAAVVALLLVAALAAGGTYGHRYLGHGVEEFQRLVTCGVFLLAALATAGYAGGGQALRGLVLVGVPTALLSCLLVHYCARLVLHELRRRGRCRQRAVVIGLERSVAELVRTVSRDPRAGLQVVGACVASSRSGEVEGVPVLGTPRDATAALAVGAADTVILTAWSDVSHEDLRRLAWDLEGSGVQLLVAPRLGEVAVPRLHLRTIAGVPLVTVEEPEFRGLRRVAKAGLDYVLTLVGLVLVAPLMLVVALAVKLTSPGPVLFRQQRVGRHGQVFTMHKFRSMYADAEQRRGELDASNEVDGPLFKLRQDPRVTPLGGVLRRYSLDELPQLLDVLAGRMSLVGPRPPLPAEVAGYSDDVRRRLLVKPGITGLWQVSGRSNLSWEESVRLDLSYVENWSLALDVQIILRTVAAVLARDGAY